MKALFLSILGVIGICLSMSSGENQFKLGEGGEHPRDGFSSLVELLHWAESSSFGGGGVSKYELGGRRIYIVNRSFTSGINTTEISVYVQQSKDARILMVLLQSVAKMQIRSKLEGESILFERYDERERKWYSTMTLSKEFFD